MKPAPLARLFHRQALILPSLLGLNFYGLAQPSDESLGYCLSPLPGLGMRWVPLTPATHPVS